MSHNAKKKEKNFFSIFQIFMNIWKVDSIFLKNF